MHSYGGAVGTDAAEGLLLPECRAEGKQGGVIHLVYLCAYILPPGGCVWGIVDTAGFAPMWPQYIIDYEDGSTFPKDTKMGFFDGESEEMQDVAQAHLVRHPLSTFKAKTRGSSWRRIPATYVVTLQDYAEPKTSNWQDIMLAKVKEEGLGLKIEVYDTHHSPYVSKQKETVDLIVQAAGDMRNSQ